MKAKVTKTAKPEIFKIVRKTVNIKFQDPIFPDYTHNITRTYRVINGLCEITADSIYYTIHGHYCKRKGIDVWGHSWDYLPHSLETPELIIERNKAKETAKEVVKVIKKALGAKNEGSVSEIRITVYAPWEQG